MLFVPWLYLWLEEQRVPSHYLAERAGKEQLFLLEELAKGDDGSEGDYHAPR